MRKHKKISWLTELQHKLDIKFGKGLYHAGFVFFLFACLSVTSCKEEKLPGSSERSSGNTTEYERNEQQSKPVRISIEKTGQTVTLNKNPLDETAGPQILDAYFAEEKDGKYKRINSAMIGADVYVVVDTLNLANEEVQINILDGNSIIEGNIPFLKYDGNKDGKFSDKAKDVNGDFIEKIRNIEEDKRYAVFKLALKGKDDVTKEWKDKISKHLEKKLKLYIKVDVPEAKKEITYCGGNDGNDADYDCWLNQNGKWFEVKTSCQNDLQIENVPALNLNDEQKAKFIATILGETWGAKSQFEPFSWVYLNWINQQGFETGMNNSYAYRDKTELYMIALYHFGFAEDAIKHIKDFVNGSSFKENLLPLINDLKKITAEKIFVANPNTIYKNWTGQGYYGDMNIRQNGVSWRTKWAKASQYFWLQKQCKVSEQYVAEFIDYNYQKKDGTGYIFYQEKIDEYFEKHPENLPEYKENDLSTIPSVHPKLLPTLKK